MSDTHDPKRQETWVKRLIRALQDLPGARTGCQGGEKPDPESYAWKETEEDYQKAQAEWLQKVRAGKEKSKE